tara:strand:- start:83 stop:310 length:228 start_codon:yes stop_codon:yes gene_type:complete
LVNSLAITDGFVIASSQHTSTAIIVNEKEERLLIDIKEWLLQLAPPLKGYKHDDLHLRRNIAPYEPANIIHIFKL